METAPDGYGPAGWQPPASGQTARATRDYTLEEALRSWQWYALWAILFLNTGAGISIFMLLSRVESFGALAVLAVVVLLCITPRRSM